MRFPADDIWKIRLGERTRLTIPFENRSCTFQEAGYYALEREIDVVDRRPCLPCDETGKTKRGKPCRRCGGYGERVYYTTRIERIDGDERVQVLGKPERIRVSEISDIQALQEGFESAEEWRDAFFATHGEHEWVWTLTFELTRHVPQYLAIQQGQVDPQQYVSSPQHALEDADAPTADEYRGWAEAAESDIRRQREIKRIDARIVELQARKAQLMRKAA